MGAWAAEAVVKVEVAKGRIEVVAPEQVNDAAAKPDAFRIAGRAIQDPRRFGNFIDLFLGFLNRVGGRFLRFGWFAIPAALRVGDRNGKAYAGYTTQRGRKLTQLERKPHCPRRMLLLERALVLRCVTRLGR
jgi:hypothetical protein